MTAITNLSTNYLTKEHHSKSPDKLRVLWLANYPLLENHKGHPASWMTALAKAIEFDVSLTIVSWNSSIDDDIITTEDNINYVYLKCPGGGIDLLTGCRLKINQLRNYIKSNVNEFDMIHIHGSENQFVVAADAFDIPKVLSVQGIISEYYKIIPEAISYRRFYWWLSGYYERQYCKRIEHFMCRTHWDTHWVKNLNPKASVHQIWEMIRPVFFTVDDEYSENKNILYVGGLQRIKGFEELLESFNLIKEKYSDTKLIILGTRPKNAQLVKSLIKRLKLNNISLTDLDFRGMQDANGLIKAYKECFCLVHPSYIDNSPNSVCEAQIAGLPVVASNVGGVSSLIEHENTGLLTSLDPKQIAFQVTRLKSNIDLSKKISSRSKIVARKRHSPMLIKEDVINTYRLIFAQNKSNTGL